MKGKSLFLLLGIVAVLLGLTLFTMLGIRNLNAAPTAAGIIMTNTVNLTWSGGSAFDTNVTGTVGTNFGADWVGQASASVAAGSTISNVTWLANDGNLQATFIVSSFSNFTGGANTATKTWTSGLTNINTTTGGVTLTVTLSPAASNEIRFWVTPPVNEVDAKVMTFNLYASNSNATFAPGGALNASNYTGKNGTNYGGVMGIYGIAFDTLMTNGAASATNWVVTVQAATMTIAKSVLIQNPFPFNGNVATPYPGARISYKLAYQNTGAGTANTVTIVETMPTNYVEFDKNSVTNFTSSAFAGTLANYVAGTGGYPLKTLAQADDDCSTNGLDFTQVVFTPNGTAPGSPGNVAAAGSGAYFYSVFLR